jgi:hypothetical protein
VKRRASGRPRPAPWWRRDSEDSIWPKGASASAMSHEPLLAAARRARCGLKLQSLELRYYAGKLA